MTATFVATPSELLPALPSVAAYLFDGVPNTSNPLLNATVQYRAGTQPFLVIGKVSGDTWKDEIPTSDAGGNRFHGYRFVFTLPEIIDKIDIKGCKVVLEILADGYAEVFVGGDFPLSQGETGSHAVAGYRVPNRVLLTPNAEPGESYVVTVLAAAAPLSAPRTSGLLQHAALEFFTPDRITTTRPVEVTIERKDPKINDLIPEDAVLEQVTTGFVFTEGPVWKDGALLFSSPKTNAIYRWSPDNGLHLYQPKSGYNGSDSELAEPGSNGNTLDPEGRLTSCQQGKRRIATWNEDGTQTVLAADYQGKKFNSPNDVVFHSSGAVYFTDPPFGLPHMFDDPRKELPFSGVFRAFKGEVTLLTDDLLFPNGIAFSPDEKTMYVSNAEDGRKILMAYPVNEDGTVGQGTLFTDLNDAEGGELPDGMKLDHEGNVFVTGPGGVWVLAPDGTRLGLIHGPESFYNLAWGDEDARTLYMAGSHGIFRMRLTTTGIRPPVTLK